ncbi:MAG: AzlD protein [Ilumatobacteraceae bacterium]|nr:AzlD protein [Ilumatobacteraceae bacterium]
MNGINSWGHMLLVCAGMAMATVVTRSSFFVLPASLRLPPTVERALRYAPACALTAIVAPDVLARDHGFAFTWHNNQLWAVLIAAAVFAKTRNMLVMMAVGMTAFTLLRLYA